MKTSVQASPKLVLWEASEAALSITINFLSPVLLSEGTNSVLPLRVNALLSVPMGESHQLVGTEKAKAGSAVLQGKE